MGGAPEPHDEPPAKMRRSSQPGSERPGAGLQGRVVVVTGGNGGIGLGLARAVAAAGASVAIWGRNEVKNAAAAAELQGAGTRAEAFKCDVAIETDVESAMASTVDRFGRVDALFANAGVVGTPVPLADATLDSWREVMATNLDGVFLCLRAAARHMIERGSGALVVVSSIVTSYGAPGKAAYAASKAALSGLARSVAAELAPKGIRCNILRPGWIDTPMIAAGSAYGASNHERFRAATEARTPVRRWGRPSDLAATAVYLADPTLTFHTGDTLTVDGGYTIY